jgi:hypothetical protein
MSRLLSTRTRTHRIFPKRLEAYWAGFIWDMDAKLQSIEFARGGLFGDSQFVTSLNSHGTGR